MRQQHTQHLEQVLIVHLDISLITENRKVARDEIGVTLPADLFAGGVLKMFRRKALTPMDTLKNKAECILEKAGTRFLSGYAVPQNKVKAVVQELEEVEKEFQAEKTTFLTNYQAEVDDWIAHHPDQEDLLRRYVQDKDALAHRIDFDFQVFRIQTAESNEDDVDGPDLGSGINRACGRMSDQLLAEVAQRAKTFMERSLLGKDKVTQRALSPIRTIREKMNGLEFLDQRIGPIVTSLDTLLAALEKVTPIEGANFMSLYGMVQMLSSPESMRAHGERILSSRQHGSANDDDAEVGPAVVRMAGPSGTVVVTSQADEPATHRDEDSWLDHLFDDDPAPAAAAAPSASASDAPVVDAVPIPMVVGVPTPAPVAQEAAIPAMAPPSAVTAPAGGESTKRPQVIKRPVIRRPAHLV